MVSEVEIILGCQQNDPRSQTAFYNMYKGRVMGICRRYARSTHEAEDIFQEAFVKIFRKIGHLQKIESISSWVKQVTVNTAINYYHQHLKDHLLDVDYQDVSISNDDHSLMYSHFSTEELMKFINRLPDGYRMVFNLYVIEGFNHVEIGEMLNISENTSKSQLSRAKELLRRQLKTVGIISYEQPE
ncbi:MAG: RNA polymerase sigma factor [Spirosomataceae bacterium]